MGCRLLDRNAKAKTPHAWALDGKGIYEMDYCPGELLNTPFLLWLHEIDQAQQNGYSLGDYNNATFAEIDSLNFLRYCRKYYEAKHGD